MKLCNLDVCYRCQKHESIANRVYCHAHECYVQNIEHCDKWPARGLGDSIAKAAAIFGIPECGGCAERRVLLNRAVPYG